jgi:hypothetical protein
MKKPNPKSPKKKKPKEPKPNDKQDVLDQMESFIEFVPARRFSRILRTWLLEFLEYDGSMEAPYIQDLVLDLGMLFDLLDKIEKLQGGIEERE